MTNQVERFHDASPFEAIRNVTLDGREWWSARDLMPLLGYDRWENFAAALDRAMAAADAQGHRVDDLFRGSTKKSGGRPQQDFELARFAAYLAAMNGDPRKPEVAAAQSYFAIKTREAETSPALTEDEIVHQALAITARRVEALTARVAELEPQAAVATKLLDATGDLSVRDAAQSLTRAGIKVGQNRLFTILERKGWVRRAIGDHRWRVMQTAIETGYMSVLPQSHYHPRTGELIVDPPQPRITPKGLQRLLSDLEAA